MNAPDPMTILQARLQNGHRVRCIHGPMTILQARLQALEGKDQRRTLKRRKGADLCSNDYLGFAADPQLGSRLEEVWAGLKEQGAAGSRLLCGHLDIHEQAEGRLAAMVGAPGARLFPSGYQANLALLQGLLGPGDLVFSDALNHASLIDGIRLSRARKVIFRHRDLNHLEEHLAKQAPERKPDQVWALVSESLFSMDGDRADLPALMGLAEKYGCLLIIDEAHSTGLFGENGGGILQTLSASRPNWLTSVHTGGKALGLGGAWIGASAGVLDSLTNQSRPFIFSTGATPILAASLMCAADHWIEVGAARAARVLEQAEGYRLSLLDLLPEEPQSLARTLLEEAHGPILPLVIGENAEAMAVAGSLQARGLDVRAVRPPTVPAGTARLRLTVCHNTAEDAWNGLFHGLSSALAGGLQ